MLKKQRGGDNQNLTYACTGCPSLIACTLAVILGTNPARGFLYIIPGTHRGKITALTNITWKSLLRCY